ncbi:MAG: DNA polymerase III subunit chi [Burkholderiales bacterium]|nr:DNA polymerase III subunit chi [Burkholderiales bacterium]
MPKVEFHTGVTDELDFACRLLRKAYRVGARVAVRAPSQRLQRLDRELWTRFEREFIPHLRVSAQAEASAQALRTPIWLVDGDPPCAHPPVLLNLDTTLPGNPKAFTRIIEIVGSDADAVRHGRERWRAYEAAGLRPVHHAAAAGAHG